MNARGKELEANRVILDEGIPDEEQWAQNVEVFQQNCFSQRPGCPRIGLLPIWRRDVYHEFIKWDKAAGAETDSTEFFT